MISLFPTPFSLFQREEFESSWGHLGLSWGYPDSSWVHPGFILGSLGSSLVILVSSWGHPWVILGHPWVILGSSWGHPGSSWGHPGSSLGHPGSSWVILGSSWVILGSSWVILGSSWGHKVSVKALEKLSGGGGWWWHSDYNLCSWSRSLSFSEILWDMVWYGMDLDRRWTWTGAWQYLTERGGLSWIVVSAPSPFFVSSDV